MRFQRHSVWGIDGAGTAWRQRFGFSLGSFGDCADSRGLPTVLPSRRRGAHQWSVNIGAAIVGRAHLPFNRLDDMGPGVCAAERFVGCMERCLTGVAGDLAVCGASAARESGGGLPVLLWTQPLAD